MQELENPGLQNDFEKVLNIYWYFIDIYIDIYIDILLIFLLIFIKFWYFIDILDII